MRYTVWEWVLGILAAVLIVVVVVWAAIESQRKQDHDKRAAFFAEQCEERCKPARSATNTDGADWQAWVCACAPASAEATR